MNVIICNFKNILIPFTIFGGLFICDLIIGITKGVKNKNFSSGKLKDSAPKFIVYTLLIISALLFDSLLSVATTIPFLDKYSPISLALTVYICLIEFISIIENAIILGLKVPKFLIKLLENLNEDLTEK